MIYLDVKYFLIVCLSICYEKLAVKTTLTRVEHFFAKKLNFCPRDIILNSSVLKWECLKHISKCLVHAFCIFNTSWREISSPCLDLGNLRPCIFLRSKKIYVQIYYDQWFFLLWTKVIIILLYYSWFMFSLLSLRVFYFLNMLKYP